MSIYHKPVRLLFFDMVDELGLARGEVITKREATEWFEKKYPKIKRSTISAHFIKLSTNAPSRVHYNVRPGDDDLFFQVDRSLYRLYESETDPSPIYVSTTISGLSKPVMDQIRPQQTDTESTSEYRRASWYEKYELAKKRIRVLEEENADLIAQLEEPRILLDDVMDETLRARFLPLQEAHLDTLLREAAVVLEDRLRQVGEIDSDEVGIKLVDKVLNPKHPTLVYSKHSGEQEGVYLLYRGAVQFIRNPPMHRLIEYHESTGKLLLRLVDSLLLLLSEGESKYDSQLWTFSRFESTLRQNASQESVRIAEMLYRWSKSTADKVKFGAGKSGSFTYYYMTDRGKVSVFTIMTNARIKLNYGWLLKQINRSNLRQFHEDLIQIPGFAHIKTDFNRYPSIKLTAAFKDAEDVDQFKAAVLGIRERL